jgi:FKBP-type peptidyl-prolyl cis-trans isomerase FklB
MGERKRLERQPAQSGIGCCILARQQAGCNNAPMVKTLPSALMAGAILLASAMAQQPAAKPSAPAPSSQTSSPAAGQQPSAASPNNPALPTEKDKLSYAIGMNVGKGLHHDGVDVDPKVLLRGLQDAMSGGQTLLTDDEARTVIVQLQNQLRSKMEAQRTQASETNKKEGEDFLAANKSKPGVVALPSGLQYKILKEGTGPKPSATDTVKCSYRGTLINGTEFDASDKHGGAITFPVNGVIKGWTEALQLMPVGSKWQLFIPSELAYGARGAGSDIGPNETLIFEVELLSIEPPKQK